MLVPDAVLGRSYLEHEVAAALQVVGRDRPLAGVQPYTRLVRTPGQGPNGRHRQGAETHGGNIEEGVGAVGLPGIARTEGDGAAGLYFFLQGRERAVQEDEIPRAIDRLGTAERHSGVDVLRRPVYPGPLGAIEGHLLPILGKEVLTEKLAEMLEQIAEASQHRVVAPDGMPALGDVGNIHVQNRQQQQANRQGDDDRGDLEKDQGKVLQGVEIEIHRQVRRSYASLLYLSGPVIHRCVAPRPPAAIRGGLSHPGAPRPAPRAPQSDLRPRKAVMPAAPGRVRRRCAGPL